MKIALYMFLYPAMINPDQLQRHDCLERRPILVVFVWIGRGEGEGGGLEEENCFGWMNVSLWKRVIGSSRSSGRAIWLSPCPRVYVSKCSPLTDGEGPGNNRHNRDRIERQTQGKRWSRSRRGRTLSVAGALDMIWQNSPQASKSSLLPLPSGDPHAGEDKKRMTKREA